MKTKKFIRKPLYVDAIQVTKENLSEIAKWCGGNVFQSEDISYIQVLHYKSKIVPRTKAFVGDWVLESRNGYRVYTDKAFGKSFEEWPEVDGEWPSTHEAAVKLMQDFDKEVKNAGGTAG